MLRRTSTSRALWPLDSDGTPRTRLGRSFLFALGIPGGFHRSFAARYSNVYRVARRRRPYAARTFPPLHVFGIVAVVPGTCLFRYETGPELANDGQVFSPLRRGNHGYAYRGNRVVCMEPLAEQNRSGSPGYRRLA